MVQVFFTHLKSPISLILASIETTVSGKSLHRNGFFSNSPQEVVQLVGRTEVWFACTFKITR
jgi:hypothetical protein